MTFKGFIVMFMVLFCGMQVMPVEHAQAVSAEQNNSSESEQEKSGEEEFFVVNRCFGQGMKTSGLYFTRGFLYAGPVLPVSTKPPQSTL